MFHLPNKTGNSSGQERNQLLLLHLPPSTPWAQSSASPSGVAGSRTSLRSLILTEPGPLALSGETMWLPAQPQLGLLQTPGACPWPVLQWQGQGI